jgi:hypothetical protein
VQGAAGDGVDSQEWVVVGRSAVTIQGLHDHGDVGVHALTVKQGKVVTIKSKEKDKTVETSKSLFTSLQE